MIKKYKLEQVADVFTGIRITRYQNGDLKEQHVLKKTYEDSPNIDTKKEFVSKDFNPKFYSQKNDIVVLLAGSVVTKLDKEGIIIPMYYAVVRVREGFDADFIYQLLKSDIFPKELHKLQEGSTLKVIKTTHLKQICLPLPDYETQRKYGNLFRLMDDRINKNLELIELERKKEKLIMKNLLDELDES
jgi:type I restriction enzyme S subunit